MYKYLLAIPMVALFSNAIASQDVASENTGSALKKRSHLDNLGMPDSKRTKLEREAVNAYYSKDHAVAVQKYTELLAQTDPSETLKRVDIQYNIVKNMRFANAKSQELLVQYTLALQEIPSPAHTVKKSKMFRSTSDMYDAPYWGVAAKIHLERARFFMSRKQSKEAHKDIQASLELAQKTEDYEQLMYCHDKYAQY